jgi:hypothetical protein
MRPLILRVITVVLAVGFLVVACQDEPELPIEPSGGVQSSAAETAGDLIDELFPAGGLRNSARTQLRNVERKLGTGKEEDAREKTFELIKFTLERFDEGRLLDPAGMTTEEAVLALTASVQEVVSLQPATVPEAALDDDGAVEVVDAVGAEVITETEKAGTILPPGAVSEPVMVFIERLPDPEIPTIGPLPTALAQYGPFYRISTSPALDEFNTVVLANVCQFESGPFAPPPELHGQLPADPLRLAQTDPDDPSAILILPLATAEEVPLDCEGTMLGFEAPASGGSWFVGDLTRHLAPLALIAPKPLYAAVVGHSGLTSSSRGFGDGTEFGGTDPTSGSTPVDSMIFLDLFNADPLSQPPADPEIGSWMVLDEVGGTILVEDEVGDLGGGTGDADRVLELVRSGDGLLRLIGGVAGSLPTTGLFNIRWESLSTGPFGGAVAVYGTEGVLAVLEYEPGNTFDFNLTQVPSETWTIEEAQNFEIIIDLDARTASLRIDFALVAGPVGFLMDQGATPLPEANLARVVVTLAGQQGDAVTFAVDNLSAVGRTRGP